MEGVIGVPVLATISLYDTPQQKRNRRVKRIVVVASIITIFFLGSLAVDRFLMPLDDLWNTFEDRLVEMGVPIEKDTVKS
jgi:hypothetical protein